MIVQDAKISSPHHQLWPRLWWWLRLTVTLLLVAYLFWRIRPDLGALRLRLAHPSLLVLALGGIVVAILLSVWQWRILILPPPRIPFAKLLTHYMWGFFWNNFLPSGLGGDVVRAWGLRNAVGRADIAVNSVLMARLSALWSIVLLAALAAPFYLRWTTWEMAFRLILITLSILAATAGATALLWSPLFSRLARRFPARLASWCALWQDYGRQRHRLLSAFLLALAVQLWAVLINSLVAQALGLEIFPWQLLLGMPLINLAVSIPLSLGGLGQREGAYLYFLGLVGAAAADAILLSLTVYILLVLVAALGAGICAIRRPPSGKLATSPGENWR